MNAKTMFEKLGYIEVKENLLYLSYIDEVGKHIRFDKDGKYIEKFIEDIYGNRHAWCLINNKELQAINKQVEELGWNNER